MFQYLVSIICFYYFIKIVFTLIYKIIDKNKEKKWVKDEFTSIIKTFNGFKHYRVLKNEKIVIDRYENPYADERVLAIGKIRRGIFSKLVYVPMQYLTSEKPKRNYSSLIVQIIFNIIIFTIIFIMILKK